MAEKWVVKVLEEQVITLSQAQDHVKLTRTSQRQTERKKSFLSWLIHTTPRIRDSWGALSLSLFWRNSKWVWVQRTRKTSVLCWPRYKTKTPAPHLRTLSFRSRKPRKLRIAREESSPATKTVFKSMSISSTEPNSKWSAENSQLPTLIVICLKWRLIN